MWRFLVDESLPRSTAIVLRQAGHMAEDARDVGLRGRDDREVFASAQVHGAVVVTADTDFANPRRFRPDTAAAIIILRVPNELSTQRLNAELMRSLTDLAGEALAGLLVIVEVGRVRIWRAIAPGR